MLFFHKRFSKCRRSRFAASMSSLNYGQRCFFLETSFDRIGACRSRTLRSPSLNSITHLSISGSLSIFVNISLISCLNVLISMSLIFRVSILFFSKSELRRCNLHRTIKWSEMRGPTDGWTTRASFYLVITRSRQCPTCGYRNAHVG